MINIEPIKAFNDNYIWLVTTNEGSIVIDPGEATKTINYLKENSLNLKGILITHHHFDHTGGIEDMLKFKNVDVYGPVNNISSINKKLRDGDLFSLIGIDFKIIEIPGHTLDHIAFFSENNGNPFLFCGDTLFSSGCGRVFEGTFEQMHKSVLKLKSLPANTKIYAGHEYTQSNLKFAMEVEPLNQKLVSRYNDVQDLLNKGTPTLPTTLELELEVNPFLRCQTKEVQSSVVKQFNTSNHEDEIFKALRQWKDNF
ncbi:hydroxyacylglutathione hydrolase [Gammaproteobacteria bacterium]|nr:hydroxyacylglutathione hydrolase [Gammaproteobacteria bacterium]